MIARQYALEGARVVVASRTPATVAEVVAEAQACGADALAVTVDVGDRDASMRGTAAYNTAKEAIRSLSRAAAAEWGRHGICVNVIIPTIVTDAARSFFEARPGIEDKLVAQIPLRRFGDVDRDIGPVAVFLACSDSDFVTGQAIHVDGGQILHP